MNKRSKKKKKNSNYKHYTPVTERKLKARMGTLFLKKIVSKSKLMYYICYKFRTTGHFLKEKKNFCFVLYLDRREKIFRNKIHWHVPQVLGQDDGFDQCNNFLLKNSNISVYNLQEKYRI